MQSAGSETLPKTELCYIMHAALLRDQICALAIAM